MTFAAAEELKRNLTDKFVVVQDGVAELRRFQGLTGTVKTVNMSGRALVQFDGPVDIGWYDIDPTYLQVVDQPQPKKSVGHESKGLAKEPAAASAKPAAPTKGGSPLDQIRKAGAAKPAGAESPASSSAGKPSPLDLIRKQGAAKSAPSAESPPAHESAAPGAAPAAPPKPPVGMSPLDLIRKQGGAKR
jgi:hypothetical protein